MIFHKGKVNSVQASLLTRHSAGLTLWSLCVYVCVCEGESVREGEQEGGQQVLIRRGVQAVEERV